MKPKILVIITTYNRPEICGRLLNSLNKITSHKFDIFLIENKSDKNYKKVFSKKYNFRLLYKKMDGNYGLPITYNQAIRYAIKNNCDYIWVLDDDTVVEENTLRYLVEELENNKYVAVTGSAIYNINKKDELMHAGAFIDFNKLTGIAIKTDKASYVDYVADCSSLARVSLIKKHRVFYDENFFIHIEDMDFPLSFKKLGYKITVNPKSKIYHINWKDVYVDKSHIVYYDVRNLLYLYMKFKPIDFKKSRLIKLRATRNIYHFLYAAILSYADGNIPIANAFYYAVKDLYERKMGKSDLYKRINLNILKEQIENKKIVFPTEFPKAEYNKLDELLKQAKNCKITKINEKPLIKKITQSLKLFKKFDYVIIPNKTNMLYPLLGKKIIKLENNQLWIYKLNCFALLRFSLKVINLWLKIIFKKNFAFNEWRNQLIKNSYKNEKI